MGGKCLNVKEVAGPQELKALVALVQALRWRKQQSIKPKIWEMMGAQPKTLKEDGGQ